MAGFEYPQGTMCVRNHFFGKLHMDSFGCRLDLRWARIIPDGFAGLCLLWRLSFFSWRHGSYRSAAYGLAFRRAYSLLTSHPCPRQLQCGVSVQIETHKSFG